MTVVKSFDDIIKILRACGYSIDEDGDWSQEGWNEEYGEGYYFDAEMFYYCGKEPSTAHKWSKDWLEYKWSADDPIKMEEHDFSGISTKQLQDSIHKCLHNRDVKRWCDTLECTKCRLVDKYQNCDGIGDFVESALRTELHKRLQPINWYKPKKCETITVTPLPVPDWNWIYKKWYDDYPNFVENPNEYLKDYKFINVLKKNQSTISNKKENYILIHSEVCPDAKTVFQADLTILLDKSKGSDIYRIVHSRYHGREKYQYIRIEAVLFNYMEQYNPYFHT